MAYTTLTTSLTGRRRKKAEAKGEKMRPSELAVQYMYSVSIANRKLSASAKRNFDFLVNRLSEKNTEFTIYGKAVSALVLAKNDAN